MPDFQARRLLPAAGPARALTIAILVTTAGNGLYAAGAVLFLTRAVGLSAVAVGTSFTVAGLAGLAAGPPVGRLADRFGPRNVYVLTLLAEGIFTAALPFVRSLVSFVLAAILIAVAEQGSRAVRGALIAKVGGRERAYFRGYLRAVTNIGLSLGIGLAGIAIQADTYTAYSALLLADAGTFVVCAGLVMRIPPGPPPIRRSPTTHCTEKKTDVGRTGRTQIGLRDKPYIAVVSLFAVANMQYAVLPVVLPLWIAYHTEAPRWLVSPLLILNTALVVIVQARVGRGVNTITDAVTITRRGSFMLLIACLTFAAASMPSAPAAAILLFLAVIAHTLGEICQAAGEFELSFTLAPDWAQGEYQGIFGAVTGLGVAAAPAVLTLLCLTWGGPGWALLGTVLVVVGVGLAPVAQWASRCRPAPLSDCHDDPWRSQAL